MNTTTVSTLVLPLLFSLCGCQNQNQHYHNRTKTLNHAGFSCNFTMSVVYGATNVIEIQPNYSSQNLHGVFSIIDFQNSITCEILNRIMRNKV